MRSLSRTFFQLLVLALLFFPSYAFAQFPINTNSTATPIPGAGHDYLGGLSETVNPANGSLSIRIPVIIPPSRGIAVPFFFAYDSGVANFLGVPPGSQPQNLQFMTTTPDNTVFNGFTEAGWSATVPMMSDQVISWHTTDLITGTHQIVCKAAVGFVFQDAYGSRHNLALTNYSDGPAGTGPCTVNSQDWPRGFFGETVIQGGEGSLLATLPSTDWGDAFGGVVTVTDANGNQFASRGGTTNRLWHVGSVIDRNGNYLSVGGTHPAFNYVDTAGRTVLQDSGFAVSPETLTVSGLGAPYTLAWTTLATPTFTSTPTGIQGNACGSSPLPHWAWNSYNDQAVSSVTLPNGKSFTFAYDPVYGSVNKMTYPTGGYVRYVWGMNANAELSSFNYSNGQSDYWCYFSYGVPALTDRYVSFDGITEVLHQHYSYVTNWPSGSITWSSKVTTVTSYDLVRNTSSETIYTYSSVTDPYQPNMETGQQPQIAVESSVADYNDLGTTLLKTVSKGWQNERLLKAQQTAFPNLQTNKTLWTYDSNEMRTEQDDYDYGNNAPGPFLRATVTNYAYTTNTTLSNAHVIDKPSSVIVYSDSAKSNKVAETDYAYDSPLGTVTSGIVQHGTGCNCGNLTTQQEWVDNSGTNKLTTTYINDDTGQRLTMVDPMGNASGGNPSQHTTTYSYTDSYSSGTPPGPTNAYLTQVTHPQTSGVSHIEKFSYAYSSGEVTNSTDQNNLVTSYKYVDNLARLTETDFPDGGVTTIAYNDATYNPSTPSPSVTTTKKINASTDLVTLSATDGLGHVIRSELTSDPQGTVYTDTAYDGLARVYTVSNPYRTGTDPTTSSGTTTYVYDAIGRKLTETYPDNSVLTTAYCAGSTLVTDPTGKWRRSRVDGLGRLVEVDEPNAPGATVASTGCPGTGEPIWVTSYTLDTLGNLKTVVQNGSHQRNFTYDWASRLLTSNNPEVGTITYNYDSDTNCTSPNSFVGLLVSKVDARGIRTCAQYDAINRETVLNYSNGDPTITTTYDQTACLVLTACQNIGQRTSVTDAAGSESWAYQVDATNQRDVHANKRTTNSIAKTSTYYFDLAGNLTQVVYPTSRTINYTYDAANRPKTAADASNGITYATDFQTAPTGCLSGAVCYTPQGTFYALSIGQTLSFTGLNLTHTYNNRLQPNEFKASSSGGSAIDITYGFVDPSTNHNAGHVYSITNNLDTTRSQNLTYDQLNRISSAQTTSTHATSPTHCWGETYQYDGVTNGSGGAWGNLTSIAATTNSNYTGCTEESGFSSIADGNNHLPAFSYDASGNTTSDGVVTYQWNAESQLIQFNNRGTSGLYAYDGDGRRVSKVGGKLYWYGSGGDILAETDTSGNTTAEYVYFGGKRVAMLQAATILDPNFQQGVCCEAQPPGWTVTSLVNVIPQVTVSKTYQVSASSSSSFQLQNNQFVPVSPGNQISFGGQVYLQTGTAGGAVECWVLETFDSNQNPVGSMVFPTVTYAPGQFWYQQTGSYTVASNVAYVKIAIFFLQSTSASTVVQFSNAFISPIPTYYIEDFLGTSRVLTTDIGTVCYDADFYPYGGERAYTNNCPQNYKFEGKERDTETGNDDFGARYYSNRFGRWLSADWSSLPTPVPYANLSNPQTLNLYSLVLDDPESFADLLGHEGGYYYAPDGRMIAPTDPNYPRSDHPIRDTILMGLGAVTALAAPELLPEAGTIARNLLGWGLATAPVTAPIVVDTIEGLSPGAPGTLTISAGTRLTEAEISTGTRLAAQTGKAFAQSTHVGEEFVDAGKKTYDAMGGTKAFEHFGDGKAFLNSIKDHVLKSVDKVAIDLKGASKDQIGAIKSFVKTLTKDQQKKIIYVQP